MERFNPEDAVPGVTKSVDLVSRELRIGSDAARLYYLSSLCDKLYIQQTILDPFGLSVRMQDFMARLKLSSGYQTIEPGEQTADKLLHGYALVIRNGSIAAIEARKTPTTKPTDATVESILQGPQTSFSEDVETNVRIVRMRYPSKNLRVEYTEVGLQSRTQLAIIYDESKVEPDLLLGLDRRLTKVKAEVVQAANQLSMLLTNRYQLFPTAMATDRPDRTILNLSQGKVILLLDGTPFAVYFPAVFYDFMVSMDDAYQFPWLVHPLQALRYLSAFITTTLPALYIAFVSYNPEFLRAQLAIEIAGSRAAVPYSSFYEVFFMLFLTEALTEASIRLPKHIGSTATTVGGLILGQAAQEAGLVSSIMIIIASAVAISNFVIPINTMSYAMRAAKFPLVLLAIYFGLAGVVTGIFGFIVYAASLQSFGRPYLKLFPGEQRKSR
ncbi:spore germination protein [Paenibacillus sp. MWE-103]|uniref:Spore germination protein n=1 Tax=Paenibacillus artemisiicola TaxID=1172618 RepID=A0ABS3W3P5_9BACL|nr:spore germination protein [Paenibacillus artemisiicola]MBO7742765.1 spore germination protein [Paenibacillus artemisiicola]